MCTEMTLNGVMGALMAFPMSIGAGRVLMKNLEEFIKHFVETGTPHPRKQKALNKLQIVESIR